MSPTCWHRSIDLVDDVPAPNAELAALLGPSRWSDRTGSSSLLGPRRSAVAGALVLALSGVGATGLSAAANTLPAPLQHQVSEVLAPLPALRPAEPPVSLLRAGATPSELSYRTAPPTSRGLALTSASTVGSAPSG